MSLKSNQPKPFVLEIRDALNVPQGAFITLADPTSAVVRKAHRDFMTSFRDTSEDKRVEAEVAAEQLLVVKAKAAILGWDEAATEWLGDKFTAKFVNEIFADDLNHWFVEQIVNASVNRENFFRSAN
jgi:hypothetical protein